MSFGSTIRSLWETVSYNVITCLITVYSFFARAFSDVRLIWIRFIDYIRSRKREKKRHGGSVLGLSPKKPKVLGNVLVQKQFGSQDDQALCRIILWAAQQGFQLCLLYCPFEGLRNRYRSLLEALQWSDPYNTVDVWLGWDAPQNWLQQSGTPSQRLGVALLSASDAEEPLVNATVQGRTIDHDTTTLEFESLQRALHAPESVKRIMEETSSGPVGTMEPDIIMIFGGISSLAGFPSWTTKSSEIYDMGQLGIVTKGKLDAALKRFLSTKQRFGR